MVASLLIAGSSGAHTVASTNNDATLVASLLNHEVEGDDLKRGALPEQGVSRLVWRGPEVLLEGTQSSSIRTAPAKNGRHKWCAHSGVTIRRPQIAFQAKQGDKTCFEVGFGKPRCGGQRHTERSPWAAAFSIPVAVRWQPETPLTEACPNKTAPKPPRPEHEPSSRNLLQHRTSQLGVPDCRNEWRQHVHFHPLQHDPESLEVSSSRQGKS